jgi:hypothetical protein
MFKEDRRMRRPISLLVLALALGLVPASAHAVGIGIGGYGGASIPIVQEDVKSGSTYGVRVPIGLIPLISIEPFYSGSNLGDAEETLGGVTYTRDGFQNTTFGVNAILGSIASAPGIKFYPYVGIASTQLTRSGSADIKEVSYNFGFGAGVGLVHSLSVHGRAELNMVKTDETSRKFGNLTIGLHYNLFSKL